MPPQEELQLETLGDQHLELTPQLAGLDQADQPLEGRPLGATAAWEGFSQSRVAQTPLVDRLSMLPPMPTGGEFTCVAAGLPLLPLHSMPAQQPGKSLWTQGTEPEYHSQPRHPLPRNMLMALLPLLKEHHSILSCPGAKP